MCVGRGLQGPVAGLSGLHGQPGERGGGLLHPLHLSHAASTAAALAARPAAALATSTPAAAPAASTDAAAAPYSPFCCCCCCMLQLLLTLLPLLLLLLRSLLSSYFNCCCWCRSVAACSCCCSSCCCCCFSGISCEISASFPRTSRILVLLFCPRNHNKLFLLGCLVMNIILFWIFFDTAVSKIFFFKEKESLNFISCFSMLQTDLVDSCVRYFLCWF